VVNAERIGRLARALRIQAGLVQADLATRAGVGRRAVSMIECGQARRLPLGTIERILGGVDARLDLRLLWNGPELDRLLDAGHAALAALVKRRLERWGWLVRVEVSYSRYGERGRMDLLAFRPSTRTLLVIELKTELVDVQALLGSLDAKARLARHVAERFAWDARSVVPAIVFAEHRTTRERLQRLAPLFDRYALRGRAAISWTRHPTDLPTGLLWFVTVPDASRSRQRQRAHRR
jgi:transcriptional regulator with XRE-family HTH domain